MITDTVPDDVSDPAPPINDIDLKHGRLGETVLESKAVNAERIATASTLLVGFTQMVTTTRDHDLVGWAPAQKAQVVLAALSTGCGISCILLCSFLAVKINRLVGVSAYRYGKEIDANTLKTMKENTIHHQQHRREVERVHGEVWFCARNWYYKTQGKGLPCGVWAFNAGLWFFLLQLISFLFSAACQIYVDTGDEKTVQILSLNFMLFFPVVTFCFLCGTKLFQDLA